MRPGYAHFTLTTKKEAVGFEPTEPFGSSVFKTDPLNRSGTPPVKPVGVGICPHPEKDKTTADPLVRRGFIRADGRADGRANGPSAVGCG